MNLKKRQKTTSQLAFTQNIIRNKFKKAFMKRIAREDDVNRVMNPLIVNHTSSAATTVDMLHNQENEQQQGPAFEQRKSSLNANILCNRLRVLLASRNRTSNMIEEIKTIIKMLRELEMLV